MKMVDRVTSILSAFTEETQARQAATAILAIEELASAANQHDSLLTEPWGEVVIPTDWPYLALDMGKAQIGPDGETWSGNFLKGVFNLTAYGSPCEARFTEDFLAWCEQFDDTDYELAAVFYEGLCSKIEVHSPKPEIIDAFQTRWGHAEYQSEKPIPANLQYTARVGLPRPYRDIEL